MIVKRNLSPAKVLGYVWRPLLYSVVVAGAVVVAQRASGTSRLAAPIAPIGTLGAALAIFVAFRNATCVSSCTTHHIILAAIPGPSLPELIDAHASALVGKLIIDASNDLRAGHASGTLSALPHLAQKVPSALGYRAFNSLGWENMADPRFGDTAADLFYAGPATDDRTVVESLITDVGFRPQYVGAGPDAHQAVDSLATLWFALAFGQHRGRRLAFRLLTDTPNPPAA